VEYLFEKGLRPNNYISNLTNSKIKELEYFAVHNADRIFAVSEEDAYCLEKIYSINPNKIDIIPNGVDIRKFHIINENKDNLKKKLNLQKKKIILFSGSKHIPNIEALKLIQKMADKLSHIDDKIVFLIAGGIGEGYKSMGNIYYTGKKDDISIYFQMADIAINPMISGSGTNLKMLEYLASGLPTITSIFGARGLGLEDGKHAIISDIDDFTKNILHILNDESLCSNLKRNGRELVEEKFDWKKIAEKVMTIYESLL
jgi:glycosyltransferase involved in cell wall biosynthesis